MSEEKSAQDVAQAPAPSITYFRLRLDLYINSIPFIRPSREVSLAHTHLQRAFMWLGKAQGAAGSESPYKESFNHKAAAIEPIADHTDTSLLNNLWYLPEYGTHTARVKSLRSLIAEHLKEFKPFSKAPNPFNDDYAEYLKQSRLAAEEASLWLGWELARIKKEIDNPPSASVAHHPSPGIRITSLMAKEKFEDRRLEGNINVACKFQDGSVRYWQTTKEEVVQHIVDIVAAYAEDDYTLTLRQLHYQFVKSNWIVNHDTAYKKLGTILDDCHRNSESVYLGRWSWLKDSRHISGCLFLPSRRRSWEPGRHCKLANFMAKRKIISQRQRREGADVLYKYTCRCKWKRGKATEVRVGDKRIMVKVYRFEENAAKFDPATFSIRNVGPKWVFFCWIPITRLKYL